MLWYEIKNTTPAISTRIRLARNIEGIPFSSKLSSTEKKSTNRMICDSIKKCDFGGIKLREIEMETLGDIESYAMVERHCISPKFAENKDEILLLSDDESVSIMIGEEDHLRIQVLRSGECLFESYELCDKIETEIGKHLKFSFDDKLGYLTECPTNLGTGMRASLMLHLPILESNGELGSIATAVNKIGLTFRGFYGEGSDSKSSIYQLSNQVTLGVSERSTIENLINLANQIITKENSALKRFDNEILADIVCRSFGVLKYARQMPTEEMMTHITRLMLGEKGGVINLPNDINLMSVFINTQPAMVKRLKGDISPSERDKFRADFLRETFKNIDIN